MAHRSKVKYTVDLVLAHASAYIIQARDVTMEEAEVRLAFEHARIVS